MKIITSDMEKVTDLSPERPALLITIATPFRDVYPTIDEDRWDEIIWLEFFDDDGETSLSFNHEHGAAIQSAVEERDWATVCVQCEAGISRSPAIADALRRFYEDDGYYRGFANYHVYHTFLEFLSGHPLIQPKDHCRTCGHSLGGHGIFFPMMIQELEHIDCKKIVGVFCSDCNQLFSNKNLRTCPNCGGEVFQSQCQCTRFVPTENEDPANMFTGDENGD